jgi:hypothetical protein
MKIQCVDRDIRQVLESGTYLIPRFQRPFSWDKDNIDEFWSDSTSEVKKDYFIGAFVTYNISSSMYGIVDGQQRLTTITIALCAIRDKYSELNLAAAANGVHRLIETRDLNDQAQFVLKAETSYPYLQTKIQSFDKEDEDLEIADEEKAIGVAYQTIQGHINIGITAIADLDPVKAVKNVKKWLDQIRDKILSLKVISITLDNQDDAYTIFETLNTRGKDLTAADLAKNHFLRLLPNKGKATDRSKDHWLEMQAELENADRPIALKTFLHHYWLSKHPFTTEKQLFKAIRSEVNALNVKETLAELRSDSDLYKGIAEPSGLDLWSRATQDISDSLHCISRILNIQIANPLLLTALRHYKAQKLKDGQVREIFSLVEKYHYIYTTVCALPSSGGVSQMYAAHARAIANAQTSNDLGQEIADFKIKIKGKIPGKDVFISKFKLLNYLNSRQRDVVRYTLWKLDKSRCPAIDMERDSASIEHILPQATNRTYTAQGIGNLILVPVKFNGERLGAKSFLDKKNELVSGGYPMEDLMLKATAWTSKEIEERASALAEYAYDIAWKIK